MTLAKKSTDEQAQVQEKENKQRMRLAQSIRHQIDEMEHMYENLFPQGWLHSWHLDRHALEKLMPTFTYRRPAVDVIEEKDKVIVRAEVPGMEKENISLLVRDSSLSLRGQKQEHKEEKEEDYYYQEIKRDAFARNIVLPAHVDPEKAEASMQDGILVITLPKRIQGGQEPLKIGIK